MAFAADITGTLAGLIPAQAAAISGLAAATPARPTRKVERRPDGATAEMTPAGELLPIGLIREAVQECLQDSILDTTGSLFALMADDEIVQVLHRLMGRPGDRETVGRSLQEVVDAFAAVAARDGQPADLVHAIGRFTDRLRATTEQLAQLRRQAAEQLADGLGKVNQLLARIAETNRQITLAGATGSSPSPAGQAQAAHLDELAKALDFACFRRDDGSVAVFTKRGVTLARDEAVQLQPSADGITADGIDIADQLAGGSVHAFLHNRDVTLPNVQSQLDTLAQILTSRINQLSNRAVGGADARAVYRGSRAFADPAALRLGLAGGDSEILLLRADAVAARATLSLVARRFRQSHGLPSAGPWPLGQLVAAFDDWLGRQLGRRDLARLSDDGRLHIDLPDGWRLAIRDSRCLALASRAVADPDRPLAALGQLTLTDEVGNEYSPRRVGAALTAQDSLRQLAAKLDRLDGLNARLQAAADGQSLLIATQSGADLQVEADGTGETIAELLGLMPAEDQAREDVAVNGHLAGSYAAATSRCFASPALPLGLQGSIILRDRDGAMLAFQTPQPDWSLERLAERLQSASDPRVTASLIASGNRFALRIAPLTPDDRFLIEGWPEGWQTTPRYNFAAAGGELAVSVAGQPAASLSIAPGADLGAIAEQIGAADGPCFRVGLRAQLLRAGNAEILDVGHRGGLPLAFAGSAVGPAAGQLDPRYNLRDQLGLTAPVDQVVAGLANFFGLNDLFVAAPDDAFDSKAAIGVFATSAAPGTAAALALNPGIARDPDAIGAAATIRQISDLLCNPMNIAEAGDLPRGSYRLAHYAEAIIRQIDSAARTNRMQLTYHRALLDRLKAEKSADIDVNRRLQTLMTLQQTYHDATQIVAGLARLNEQLKAPVH